MWTKHGSATPRPTSPQTHRSPPGTQAGATYQTALDVTPAQKHTEVTILGGTSTRRSTLASFTKTFRGSPLTVAGARGHQNVRCRL